MGTPTMNHLIEILFLLGTDQTDLLILFQLGQEEILLFVPNVFSPRKSVLFVPQQPRIFLTPGYLVMVIHPAQPTINAAIFQDYLTQTFLQISAQPVHEAL